MRRSDPRARPSDRVLVVDDDEAWVSLVTEAFRRVGSVDRLEVSSNADDAMTRLATSPPPATAVLDLNLAGRDGIELLRRLQDIPLDGVRLVVMSSSAARKDQLAVEALGAEFVTKPTSFDRLCELVAGFASGAAR